MKSILHKFKITYKKGLPPVMYAKLTHDRYTKMWYENWQAHTQMITLQEYASALAHLILNPKDTP